MDPGIEGVMQWLIAGLAICILGLILTGGPLLVGMIGGHFGFWEFP